MSAALVLLLLAAEPEAITGPPAPAPTTQSFKLHVGGQVGFPFLLGATGVGTFFVNGKPRFDVDATWEPSVMLQSYSVGAAYHVLDSVFFVGPRVRVVQFQPPWARGPVELFPAFGLDLGVRLRVGPDAKGVIAIGLHGSFIPGQGPNLKTLFGLSAGFSWAVFER